MSDLAMPANTPTRIFRRGNDRYWHYYWTEAGAWRAIDQYPDLAKKQRVEYADITLFKEVGT